MASSERCRTSSTAANAKGSSGVPCGEGRSTLHHFFPAKKRRIADTATNANDTSCTTPVSPRPLSQQPQETMTPPIPPSQQSAVTPSTPPSPIGRDGGGGSSGTKGAEKIRPAGRSTGSIMHEAKASSSSMTATRSTANTVNDDSSAANIGRNNNRSTGCGSARKQPLKMAPIFVTPAAKKTNTNERKKQPPRLAPIFSTSSGSAASATASAPAATSTNGGSGGGRNHESDDDAYSAGASDDEGRRSGLVHTSTQRRHRRPPLAPLFATPRTNLDRIALMTVTPSTEATIEPFGTSTAAAASSSRSGRKRPRSSGSRDDSDRRSVTANASRSSSSVSAGSGPTSTQMYLDLGQSNFAARSICAICGMMTVHGMDEDDAEHERICAEYRNGVSFTGWKNERVVATFPPSSSQHMAAKGAARIVEVRPSDPAQHRRRVRRVKVIVDQELGFADSSSSAAAPRDATAASGGDFASAGGSGSDDIDTDDASLFGKTAFLYVANKTVVGLCTVELIQSAHRLLDASSSDKEVSITMSNLHRSIKPTKAIMGVHQLWCHSSHRKGGVATHLVDAARTRLVYGMTVPHDTVAFSSPTVDGLTFAKKYVETATPLVYDCH